MSFGIIRSLESFVASLGKGLVAGLESKPARDLTTQEAFNLMMYLVVKGDLQLVDPIKTGQNGDLISPKPGQQVRIGTQMAGVQFLQALGMNRGPLGSVGAHDSGFFQPTPQFAIVLYRLALWLQDQWGATEIVWGGIGAGRRALDCHLNGNCVDFYGARTQQGFFDVRRDWFLRPVIQNDGKHLKGDWDRWGDVSKTFYRLSVNDDTTSVHDAQARVFFSDVWEFVYAQCHVGPNDIAPGPFFDGGLLKPGYTIHPDYPLPTKRRDHNDHMHFQLGEAFPKA